MRRVKERREEEGGRRKEEGGRRREEGGGEGEEGEGEEEEEGRRVKERREEEGGREEGGGKGINRKKISSHTSASENTSLTASRLLSTNPSKTGLYLL